MIRAICLNPNIDRSFFIDSFVGGIRYKGNTPDICAGGKGINVAKVVAALGSPVCLYCFTGGYTGEWVRKAMEAVCTQIRNVKIDGLTRETINIIDRKSNKETEIVELGPKVTETQKNEMLAYLEEDISKNDVVICSGLSIRGMPKDIYARISRLCAERGALCFLDANGEGLQSAIYGHFFLWKPNQNELSELSGCNPSIDPYEVISQVEQIPVHFAENILVSLGPNGGLLCSQGRYLKAYVPDIPIVSTIGSGDSVVAGFTVAVSEGRGLDAALKQAMACGVVNAMSSRVADVSIDQVREIEKEIQIEEITKRR